MFLCLLIRTLKLDGNPLDFAVAKLVYNDSKNKYAGEQIVPIESLKIAPAFLVECVPRCYL